MTKNNDFRILEMKKLIEKKRESIEKNSEVFSPRTTLVFDWNSQKYNLNVLSVESLLKLLFGLEMYKVAMTKVKELHSNLSDDVDNIRYSGFSIEDLIHDVLGALKTKKWREESAELKKLGKKLDDMISDDKRLELELDDIESFLLQD